MVDEVVKSLRERASTSPPPSKSALVQKGISMISDESNLIDPKHCIYIIQIHVLKLPEPKLQATLEHKITWKKNNLS